MKRFFFLSSLTQPEAETHTKKNCWAPTDGCKNPTRSVEIQSLTELSTFGAREKRRREITKVEGKTERQSGNVGDVTHIYLSLSLFYFMSTREISLGELVKVRYKSTSRSPHLDGCTHGVKLFSRGWKLITELDLLYGTWKDPLYNY